MTLYEISVRQTRDLPVVSLFPHPASFRFHLTMDTLAFGYILPTTGWIRDFNPLETCAAGRTTDKHPEINGFPGCLFLSLVIVYPNLQFSARFFLVIMPERILLSYLPSSSMYQTVLVSVTVVHHIMLWLDHYELLPLIHRPQLRSLLMPLALPYL